jgi:copper resistance protein B
VTASTWACLALAAGLLMTPAAPAAGQAHEHPQQPEPSAPPEGQPPFIPRLSDEDRRAAFPDVEGHAAHDLAWHSFVLVDGLEWRTGSDANGLSVDARGWFGGDRNRLWFRAEGESERGDLDEARGEVFYGRQISRWWDAVFGVRQDARPGSPQTWAAAGIQGLAPYWFEVEATGYVGAGGRTQVRFEVEYELLLTNRLVLKPLVELELTGKSDPERGVEAGLSRTEAGFRLRYEIRREVAPYAGIVWETWKGDDGADGADGARFVTGLRLWF